MFLAALLAGIPNYQFLPTGPTENLFQGTYLTVAINNVPAGGYKVTLIGLIIIIIIALAANAITEKLTSNRIGGLFGATIVTILGSYLTSAYVLLPFDFELEGVRIIAALLGAIIIAVFYTLTRQAMKPAKK